MNSTVAGSQPTPHRTWISIAFALILFALLAVLVALSSSPYFAADLAVSRAVQSIHSPWLESFMHLISLAGDDVLWSSLLVAGACVVLLALRAWRETAVLLGVVLVGQALKIGIKQLIGRPRPSPELVNVLFDAKEIHSFPSGHTVHYTVFFGFLCFLTYTLVKPPALRWPLLVVFGGMVILVGLARVYLGAHWISDVVGGYLLGGALLAIAVQLYWWWSRHAASRASSTR